MRNKFTSSLLRSLTRCVASSAAKGYTRPDRMLSKGVCSTFNTSARCCARLCSWPANILDCTVPLSSCSRNRSRSSSSSSRSRLVPLSQAAGSTAMSEPKKRKLHTPNAILDVENGDALQVQHGTGAKFKVPGLQVTDHFFKVPLDHSGEQPGEITLFVRELVAPVNARRQQPYLLYLQGGPGFESPRPCEASGWLKSAVGSFRVVLLDQRGTGRSDAITTANLARRGTAQQQAEYLSFFRADSIVADAELVRQALVPRNATTQDGKWSILGQSFGGFCALTYLSHAPQGLTEVLTTGGIPPRVADACSAERVYSCLYSRVLAQNVKYYARFPGDVAVVQRIVNFLAEQPDGGLRLPSGTLLTPRAFQLLGLSGLGSGGGFERLHYLMDEFFDSEQQVNPAFIKAFEAWMPWDTNPLYALLHEAIYCQGAASSWAAQRVRQQHFAADFDAVAAAQAGKPVMFTGEMVFPWMFEDFAALRPYKAAADLLAAKQDWSQLYRPEVLASSQVPLAAASYVEDMYVDFSLVQETLGGVSSARQWVTNEYKHSGIRDDGARIIDRLLGMVRDVVLLE